MPNSKALFTELVSRIRLEESKEEIESIVYLLLEKNSGISKMDVMLNKNSNTSWEEYESILDRINRHEPVQYILGEAEFFGRSFKVGPSVLIPRPETELLVQQVLNAKLNGPAILDIGTGSGCIAITLALEIPEASLLALDLSEVALAVARENAHRLNAKVNFIHHDILKGVLQAARPLDAVVSNPPYVLQQEKDSMKPNVTLYEPALALFVPDADPLLFYRVIAKQGKALLRKGGSIFLEINEALGQPVAGLFEDEGYHQLRIISDLDGKDRIVTALH